MVKNTEDNVRRLRPGRAWSEQEALGQIRHAGRIEVASITALGKAWGWEQSRASKAVIRWERAGHIVREQGAGGKIVIRVPGQDPGQEAQEERQEGQERAQETQESGQEHVIDPPQEHGIHAAVPGVPAHVPAPLPIHSIDDVRAGHLNKWRRHRARLTPDRFTRSRPRLTNSVICFGRASRVRFRAR